jgi:hypothetical protein
MNRKTMNNKGEEREANKVHLRTLRFSDIPEND